MRQQTTHTNSFLAFGVLLCLSVLTLAIHVPHSHATSSSQSVFRSLLLKDSETSESVKRLLKQNTAYVNPKILYSDLTGDGRLDATVRVSSGGAAGDIALYVLSSASKTQKKSNGKLHAVYRNQSLYRVSSVRVVTGRLHFKVASYRQNDNVCCPSAASERELAWHAKSGTFSSRTVS